MVGPEGNLEVRRIDIGGLLMYITYPIADYDEMCAKLTADLIRTGRRTALMAVVFAHPKLKFAENAILPLVPYWNYRSRDYITFFFPGYQGDSHSRGDSHFAPILDPENCFHDALFVDTVETFEGKSSWRYPGRSSILISRAVLKQNVSTKEKWAFPDFSRVVEFDLEAAVEDEVISSVEKFFESLIRFAKSYPDGNRMPGDRELVYGLAESGLENIPIKGLRRILKVIEHLREKDKSQ